MNNSDFPNNLIAAIMRGEDFDGIEEIEDFSDVARAMPEFVWNPYLPKGGYTILFADSGVGKSIVCCGIAASISAGKPLPGEISREPGTVLFISSDDDGAHIKSRVVACGGNPDNVYVSDRMQTVGLELLGADMQALEETVNEIKPQLIVIDPWQAFIGSSVDVNRINHVRPVMARIAQLAEKCGCSIILISHINKRAQGENANYAVSGSTELVNASRSAFTVVYDNNPDYPEDRDSRILVHTKSNKSCLGQSIIFRTTDDKLTWGDFSEIDKSTLEYAAQHRISLYEALKQQHSKHEDFSDVVRAIVQIRKSHTEPEVKVTYDDLTTVSPMGEAIWKNRKNNQRKRIIQGLLNTLHKDHNIAICFIDYPFSKLYDKKSNGRGFAISYIDTPVSTDTSPAQKDIINLNLEEFALPTLPKDVLGTLYYVMYETLSCHEADILLMRYSAKESYQAISEKYAVTTDTVRRCEAKALRKLQTSEKKKLILCGIEKNHGMSFANGYKEGERAAKREIFDMLSEQLYGSKDNIPIEDMELSVRTFNTLKRAGINTLSDILREKKEGLKKVGHLGRNSYNEVVEILVARYGQERSEWMLDAEGN